MTTTSCKTAVLSDISSVHPELNINHLKNEREIEEFQGEQNQPQPAIKTAPIEQVPQSVVEALPVEQPAPQPIVGTLPVEQAVAQSAIEALQVPQSVVEALPVEQPASQPVAGTLPIEQAPQLEQDLSKILNFNEDEGQIQDCLELAPEISTFDYFQESSYPLKHPGHIMISLLLVTLAYSQTYSDTTEYDTSSHSETRSSDTDFSGEEEIRASSNADNSSSAEMPEGNDLELTLADHEDENDQAPDNESETKASTKAGEIAVIQSTYGEPTPSFLGETDD